MKILIVSYLPAKEKSRTKRLLDTFFDCVEDKNDVEILDLLEDAPDFVNPQNLEAYKQRNYIGKQISKELQDSIQKFDRMTAQFKSADIVVMAFPLYNFSLPGAIKTYFDSVMLKGETFSSGPKGFVGLMKGKKALVLMSSGGKYPEDSKYDLATPLLKLEFGFMGFSDIKIVMAQGLDIALSDVEKIITDAKQNVKSIVTNWDLE